MYFWTCWFRQNINFCIDEINIVKKKRIRRFLKDFANTTWTNEKIQRIFVFHTTMMIVFKTKTSKFKIKTISSFKFHINNLSKSSFHWRVMLRHSHVEEFLKVAQMKYDVIETRRTWKIVEKWDDYKLISLKWIFIYRSDFDDFLFKYKARIVIRDDLQKINNVQNVYAATFALKILRMMMTFVVDFHLKIKQLNAVNVFLNVFNDEKIYCHISNEYKQFKKSWNCFEHCTIKENRLCYDCEYWSTNVLNSNWILFLTNSAYSSMIMKFWCFFMWTTSFSHLLHRERKTQRI
jgi:hypothetical protein